MVLVCDVNVVFAVAIVVFFKYSILILCNGTSSFRSIHLDLRSINKTPNDQQAINCKCDREEQNHTLTSYCLHHLVTPVEVGNHTSKREKEI